MRRLLMVMALMLSSAAIVAHAEGTPPSVMDRVEHNGVVNLNSASEEQLELLPGIGPTKAKAIVEHRHGHPFHKADELMKVKGIGKKTFGHLRPYLTTIGPTTLTAEVKLRR